MNELILWCLIFLRFVNLFLGFRWFSRAFAVVKSVGFNMYFLMVCINFTLNFMVDLFFCWYVWRRRRLFRSWFLVTASVTANAANFWLKSVNFLLKSVRRRRNHVETFFRGNVPEAIVFGIISRLPVKSVLRCRCVCKSWKDLISSSGFVDAHVKRNAMKNSWDYMLVDYFRLNRFCLFDVETFAECIDRRHILNIHGSCNGLLCVSHSLSAIFDGVQYLYLWNPLIRKSKRLPEGLISTMEGCCFVGLGLRDGGSDYKVVRIWRVDSAYVAEVYSLKSNSWRITTTPPPLSPDFSWWRRSSMDAFLNGVGYWVVKEHSSSFILSFDFAMEIFQTIELPDLPPDVWYRKFTITAEESLSLFDIHSFRTGDDLYCGMWVFEANSWKRIHTFESIPGWGCIVEPLGIRPDGRLPLVSPFYDMDEPDGKGQFFMYDPQSEKYKHTGIPMACTRAYAVSASLLLLDEY